MYPTIIYYRIFVKVYKLTFQKMPTISELF